MAVVDDEVEFHVLGCRVDKLGTIAVVDHIALHPQKRGCLLGGGGWGVAEGGERVKAPPRIPPEKDRRARGALPEQWQY